MSNLGFQSLYHRTASFHGIRPWRFFFEKNDTLFSPEARGTATAGGQSTPAGCDVILFTVSFELDYVHIIRMLMLSGLSPLRVERDMRNPLVIVGGMPITVNPRILAPVADVIFRGDMEAGIDRIFGLLMEHGFRKDTPLLEELSSLKGVFVPAVDGPPPSPAISESIEEPAHTVIMAQHTEFSGMFLIEICRGCRNTCTFCMVRCAASPPRCVPVERVLDTVADVSGPTAGAARGGFTRVGLIAPVLTDHENLAAVVRGLNEMGKRVSFSSLRADDFNSETARLLRENGQTTVTFAPETGSSDLRRRIGKRLTEEALFDAVSLAQEYGARRFRYYIMYGLPGETGEDIAAVLRLVEKTLAILRPSGSRLHMSVNPFIPKKQTPLEGFEIYPIDYYRKWASFLRERLGVFDGLSLRMEPLRHVRLQYYLSVGGESTGELLCRALMENKIQLFVKSAERTVRASERG